MPKPISNPVPIHTRSYDCQAFDDGDGRLRIRGHLTDTKPLGLGESDGEPLVIHEMTVDLVVAVPSFEIVDVEAEMVVHPYLSCTQVLDDYRKLIGESITRGYSRRVKDLFGGPNGCSHVGALLQAMGPVAIQASWSLLHLHDDPAQEPVNPFEADDPEERARRLRMNTNTCHVWAEDGEHLTALAQGELRRPGWEQDRRRKLGFEP